MIFKIARAIKSWVHLISHCLNYIGMFILMVMMLMIIVDIFLRNFFNNPLQGSFELVEYMMVVTIFFFFASAQVKKGNIAVEMIINKLPQRVRACCLSINYLIATVLFVLISQKMLEETILTFTRGDLSPTLSLPHWPFLLATTVGAIMMTLVLLIDFVSYVYEFIMGKNQNTEEITNSI